MSLTYILIDFENVKPTAADLKLIRGADYRVRLFHGPHQNKFDADIVKALQPLGIQVEFIQCEHAGKNALDFHIAFYLGRMFQVSEIAAIPPGALSPGKSASFFIVSKDSGFDVLLGHIRTLGYSAARVENVHAALGFDRENDSGAAKEPVAKPTAKKAAAKLVTNQESSTAKAQPSKKVAKAVTPQSKKAEKREPWVRTIENLRDHPNNRPTTVLALERHLSTILGKETSAEAVKALVERLKKDGVVLINGKKVEYKIPAS
jgi:hypothetical protein